MSWLTLSCVRLSRSARAVYRSVVYSAAVAIPSGASHFASPLWRWKGEVQIARWSCRMFLKNLFSRDGVGDGCGVGMLAGACADTLDTPATMMMKSATERPTLPQCTFARFKFMVSH